MGETYRQLGPELGWTMGATLVLVSIILTAWISVRAKKLKVRKSEMVMAGLGLLFTFSPVPILVTVFYPAVLLIGGVIVFFKRGACNFKFKDRLLVSGAFAALAIGSFFMFQSMYNGSLVLAEDHVTWRWYGYGGTVPRDELRVHATRSTRAWYSTSDWWSWTSYSGEELGPDPMGFELYWGPDGLVTGDDLGKRLAEWAGTEPEYRFYED